MAQPYLTEALLTSRVGGDEAYASLLDDDGDGFADPGVATLLLTQVDQLVDAYARRGGYTTPLVLTDIAPIIAALLDIANYKAKARGNRKASDDDKHLYDEAIKLLQAIADGSYTLPSFTSTAEVTAFAISSEPQIFSRTLLRNF